MNIIEKLFTKEEILFFNKEDWKYEESSGYDGYRNINEYSQDFEKWIYDIDFANRKYCYQCYHRDYKLLHEFRLDCLPFGEYPDYVIQEFLNKKYFKETEL